MKKSNPQSSILNRAFTLIELLVVIAIIAILAAILFPVFATVRESTRQGSAMSNMHAVYLGARLFYEDEGRYPTSLFGYAEVPVVNATYDPNKPSAAPARPGDTNITPMSQATGNYYTDALSTGRGLNHGYLFHQQVQDFETFLDPDNPTNRAASNQTQITAAVYPITLPTLKSGASLAGKDVVWSQAVTTGACPKVVDSDYPTNPNDPTDIAYYKNVPKMFYKMDSMDIGPAIRIDAKGNPYVLTNAGATVYELHYSPDWTKERYDPANGCDSIADSSPNGSSPIVTQLKYKNPPTERTILTYITDHVATAGSNNVLILLMSGTARTLNVKQALDPTSSRITLPLNYK